LNKLEQVRPAGIGDEEETNFKSPRFAYLHELQRAWTVKSDWDVDDDDGAKKNTPSGNRATKLF
jgi:hypothetical protein